MQEAELVMILLAASAAMAMLADRLALPRPVLLVLGGAVLAMTPMLPRLQPNPEIVFLLFVPPLLYRGAAQTSLRDFRKRLQPIAFLSVVMVLATTAAVAAVAHACVPGLSWAQCFVLGAIISPTDTVAALAVTRRLRVPRPLVTILQGEGLVNDATALIAYRAALASAVGGAFSLYGLLGSFILIGAGGVVVGLVVGWCIHRLRLQVDDVPVIQNTISLLTPYAAYVPADQLGLSGVLSVVSAGMYLGWHNPSIASPATRLQADAMWDMIVFVLEGLIFILVGLELPYVLETLRQHPLRSMVPAVAAVSTTAIAIRLALVFPGIWLIPWRHHDPHRPGPTWREALVVGWAGMRGGESLVIALTLPLVVAGGGTFWHRDLIIFLTFAVILATLLLQGASLSALVRALGLQQDSTPDQEEAAVRVLMARAALDQLNVPRNVIGVPAGLLAHLREKYEHDAGSTVSPARSQLVRAEPSSSVRLRLRLIEAQRRALVQARNEESISDDVMRCLQRELDLQTAQLG